MSEALKDRYATKEQMDQYLKQFGVSRQEYEKIQEEAREFRSGKPQQTATTRNMPVRP